MADESFGTRLRRERERRKIALSSIAASTKISLGLLQALERDDVSRWPAGVFRRAFIRAYAEAAGLDPVAITQEFFETYPEPTAAAAAAPRQGAARRGTSLRLTFGDDDLPFLQSQLSSQLLRRLVAAIWDFSVTLGIGLLAFLVLGTFWIPFAVGTACYHAAAALVLGSTPGAFLFSRPTSRHATGTTSGPAQENRPLEVAGEIHFVGAAPQTVE